MTTTAGQRRTKSTSGQHPAAKVRNGAREAADSRWVDRLARLGLAARGLVYVMVGVIALQIAFGRSTGEEADGQGALAALASHPLGKVVVGITALGFVGYAVWRFCEAVWGHRDADGLARTGQRVASVFRGIAYAVFAVTAARLALGAGSSGSTDQHSKQVTAGVLGHTGGRPLVLAVGVGFVVAGIGLAYRAVRRRFDAKLKQGQMSSETQAVVTPLGVVGNAARGFVFALIGVFLVQAAVTYDPERARGLDDSLKTLASSGGGKATLVAVALGLLAFGLFSFAAARYERTGADGR